MNIGRMDRQIAIQTNTPSRDPNSGEEVEAWTTLATVWAEVIPVGGREAVQAQQMVARRQSRFRIWYLAGFNEKGRIQFDGLNWNILNLAEIGRREGLEILAEAVNP